MNRNRLTDTESNLVLTSGERKERAGAIGYEIKSQKLLCIKKLSNKDILYKTWKYSHYFIITLNGV